MVWRGVSRVSEEAHAATGRGIVRAAGLAQNGPNNVPYGPALLGPEEDGSEELAASGALSGERQEVLIIGQQHALLPQRLVEQLVVIASLASQILDGDDVHSALA